MFTSFLKQIFLFVAALTLTLTVTPAIAADPSPEIPFLSQWAGSAHAKAESEAFRHWDKDGAVPKACAKCHSSDGFRDFIGADGSAAGVVDHEASTTTVITCITCHNDVARELTSVTFPSGLTVGDAGPSARCMTCHQGRQSSKDVSDATHGLALDQVNDKLTFLNVHYRAAAATLWGTKARVGYEYDGIPYQGRSKHWSKLNECSECHDPHALEVRTEVCEQCHENVSNTESLRDIRWSRADFDGDGNVREGMAHEVDTMHTRLLAAIQNYAKTVVGEPIAYDPHAYPYFFNDNNANGIADPDEATNKNKYVKWTPRLLKAAYNYQFVAKDPGAYAHNPAYTLQLLYDSLGDLSNKVPVAMGTMTRP